jgi:hypothetical protein
VLVFVTSVLSLAACARGDRGEPPVRLVRGANAPGQFDRVRLSLTGPDGPVAAGTAVPVGIHLTGFDLGVPTPGAEERGLAKSADGQHVHLMVDDQPYRAIYDVRQPVDVGPLSAGWHMVRAFPSRQWHESVKADSAFALLALQVGETGAPAPETAGVPLLTYSRPKGEYAGPDADSVMVDFYLRSVTLTPDGYRVRLTVDTLVSETLTAWVPYYLVGLPAGPHRVALELIGPDGAAVPGTFGRGEQVITVVR